MNHLLDDVSRETSRNSLLHGAEALGLTLAPGDCDRLLNYLSLLLKWNRVYNLTSIRKPADMVSLHLLDSMSIVPTLDRLSSGSPIRLLDIGAGAGLPGLVLATLRPQWTVTLIDAVQKKVAFMTQAIGELGLRNSNAVHGRVEQYQSAPKCDVVVSRAFSDLSLFTQLASGHLAPHGHLCAMRGKIDPDLQLPMGWSQQSRVELVVPGVSAQRHLIVLKSSKG